MKSTDVFQSNYLKKEDILNPTRLTIDHVKAEDVAGDDGKERKAVIYFREPNYKPMIVNKGNWITIGEAYGDESDGWHGKPIEVYVDPSVMFGGKRVGGVRVRIPQNAPTLWTLDEAIASAIHAGLTRDEVLNNLKALGIKAYNRERCTPLVQAMIANVSGSSSGDTPLDAPKEEEIPF